MLYRYTPTADDPQRDTLPAGLILSVIPGTRQGDTVQVKDTTGEPLGRVNFSSLEAFKCAHSLA